MTCLESMHSPTQKLRNSFLSILVPMILRSDKNCGCAGIFRDAGVRFLRFTRHWAWNYGFCFNFINNNDILVLIVAIPMYFMSGKTNIAKNVIAIPYRAANQAKSKMAANSLENWKKAMIWWLIDIEWWFWCPNTGLLTQGLTQRQQNNCMSNIWWPNPRWPPFCQKKAKIAMKYELIDLEWRFWSPYIGLLSQGLTSIQKKMYAKYLVAESKMGAISNENIPKYLIRYELMELEWWS